VKIKHRKLSSYFYSCKFAFHGKKLNMNASDKSPFGRVEGPGGKIFLVGFMGSGKTHWGKIWAAQTGLQFFDLDHVIEAQENKTVAEIFEQNGEAYFRQMETDVLASFSSNNNCIISCGGGTPCFNNNIQWMNAHGTSIYFSAAAPDLLSRIIDERAKRPVFKDVADENLLTFIENKLAEREPFYSQAAITLPVKDITADTIKNIFHNV
jgi:shikimate kinase